MELWDKMFDFLLGTVLLNTALIKSSNQCKMSLSPKGSYNASTVFVSSLPKEGAPALRVG